MPRVVSIVNQKGGVGKTTTAVNLAASVAVLEHPTLLVDMDPQGNSTSGLGIDRRLRKHSYHALLGLCDAADVVCSTLVPFLSLIPSGQDLTGAEIELVGQLARENKLKKALAEIASDFEYVFIDCPPSLGLLTLNALVASDSVIVPVQSEYFAMEGLADLMQTLELVKKELNQDLVLEGVLLTMVDERTRLARDVVSEVRQHFSQDVFHTQIPRNIKLSECPSHGRPILMYDIASKGSRAYLELAAEFINRSSK